MNKIVETIASHIIEEIDEHIDNAIHWAIDDDALDYDDELELKVNNKCYSAL